MVLEKIKYESKRKEITAILKKAHPNHQERQWLVGFLSFVGYSYSEICNIIQNENQWLDYIYDYTNYQISTVLAGTASRSERSPNGEESMQSSQPRRAKTWVHAMIDTTKHKQHCSIGCGKCIDLKCIDALRYLNDNTMQNMQSRNRN